MSSQVDDLFLSTPEPFDETKEFRMTAADAKALATFAANVPNLPAGSSFKVLDTSMKLPVNLVRCTVLVTPRKGLHGGCCYAQAAVPLACGPAIQHVLRKRLAVQQFSMFYESLCLITATYCRSRWCTTTPATSRRRSPQSTTTCGRATSRLTSCRRTPSRRVRLPCMKSAVCFGTQFCCFAPRHAAHESLMPRHLFRQKLLVMRRHRHEPHAHQPEHLLVE